MIRRTVSGIAVKYIAFLQSKEKYFSCSAVVWVLFSMAYGKMANSFPQQSDRPVHWEAHNYYFLIFFFSVSWVRLSHLPSQPVSGLLLQYSSAELTKPKLHEWQQRKTQMLLHQRFCMGWSATFCLILSACCLLLTSSVLALGRSMGLCQGKAEHGGQKEGKRKWAVTLYIPTTHCKISLFRA